MKKILTTAALSSALIVGGATAAFATHEQLPAETSLVSAKGAKIQLDGEIRLRGYSLKDESKDSAPKNAYDSRERIGVKARLSDHVLTYMQLESESGSGDSWTWGGQSDASLSTGGAKNASSQLEFLQAWIDYSPGDWGIRAGHMPIALGNKLFYDHTGSGDDAIQLYGKFAGTHVTANMIKLQENGTSDNSADLDAYMLSLERKFNDSFKGGINYTLVKGGAEDDGTAGAAFSYTNWANNFPGMELSNVGINADLKFGNLTIGGDAEFQFGDLYDAGSNTAIDAGGYAYQLTADYKMDKNTVGLLFGYGSGDDNATDKDHDTFVNFLTDTPYQVYIPGYRIGQPGSFTFDQSGANQAGLQNMTIYQVNGSTSVTCPLTGKPLSLFGSLSYMETSEDVAVSTTKEDEIGTELDIVATWKLSSGLTYKVEAAYLWTGDAYKTALTGAGSDPDDAYFLRHGLEVKF